MAHLSVLQGQEVASLRASHARHAGRPGARNTLAQARSSIAAALRCKRDVGYRPDKGAFSPWALTR